MTDMTEQELQREVEAQALADRVWEILMQRVNVQLAGVIALEPTVLHPHIDSWFSQRTGHHPDKVAGNTLTELIADSLAGNWRMQSWFKQNLRNVMQDFSQRM
jgi:hypothetical protein